MYRKLFSDNMTHIYLFLHFRYCRWNWRKCLLLLDAASTARFASTTTRVRSSCSLPLDAIIQGSSLPAFTCLSCIYKCIRACRRMCMRHVYTPYMYTHAWYTPQANRYKLEQVTFAAAASYTQCVPVDEHACCFIHKPIETYTSTGETHSARHKISKQTRRTYRILLLNM